MRIFFKLKLLHYYHQHVPKLIKPKTQKAIYEAKIDKMIKLEEALNAVKEAQDTKNADAFPPKTQIKFMPCKS